MESGVTYSFKEVADRIDRRLETIDLKLDVKADRTDHEQLRQRVDQLEAFRMKVAGALLVITAVVVPTALKLWGVQ